MGIQTSEFLCPKCGSTSKFEVEASIMFTVDGNRKVTTTGLADLLSEELDPNGHCVCCACGHEDLAFKFQRRIDPSH